MKRETLVCEIIQLLENLPTVESDTFDIYQFYPSEMTPFWNAYYDKDFTTAIQLLVDGVWGDTGLHRFKDQLERVRDLVF